MSVRFVLKKLGGRDAISHSIISIVRTRGQVEVVTTLSYVYVSWLLNTINFEK